MTADVLHAARMIEAKDRLVLVKFDNGEDQNMVINTDDFTNRFKFFGISGTLGESIIRITYSSVYRDKWVASSVNHKPESLKD